MFRSTANFFSSFFTATVHQYGVLEVWQLARKACRRIYSLTSEELIAKDFRYKTGSGGRCGSIKDNLAGGFGRGSKHEFVNSLTTAKGEAEEIKSKLYRALDVCYFPESLFQELYAESDLLVRKISAVIQYLNQSNIRRRKFEERNYRLRKPKHQTSNQFVRLLDHPHHKNALYVSHILDAT